MGSRESGNAVTAEGECEVFLTEQPLVDWVEVLDPIDEARTVPAGDLFREATFFIAIYAGSVQAPRCLPEKGPSDNCKHERACDRDDPRAFCELL